MRSQARVVVIGGGVVGVSTLYHLVKKGWTDCVLVERKELTSGSTWHAAGLLPLFNVSYSVGQIHKYSVGLYRSLEAETGQAVGFRPVSNIRLARTKDRWDEYHYYAGISKTIGSIEVKFLTPAELKEIWPLCNTDGILGAMQHPQDGYIQPADLTQALARGARAGGGEINRNTTVLAIERTAAGEWLVRTDKGDITCEHVVSCSGNFARQTGRMVGLQVPVIPVEHQYIVTEPHPAIQERKRQGLPEMGVLRESDSSWYMREEAGGLLLGPYEKGAPVCYVDGPSKESEYELFQEDLERLMPHVETAIERVPAFGEVGIKKIYNGAIAYTPDGNPIVGPAAGVPNFWLNEGHSFGVTAAGGAGWQLAEWIVEGEPSVDMMGVDPRRFGRYAAQGYLIERNEEAYAKVFSIHYPEEERGCGARAPAPDALLRPHGGDLGAVFGAAYRLGAAEAGSRPPGYALSAADLATPRGPAEREPRRAGRDRCQASRGAVELPALQRLRPSWARSAARVHETRRAAQDMSRLREVRGVRAGCRARGCRSHPHQPACRRRWTRVTLTYLLTERSAACGLGVHGLTRTGPARFYLVSAGALERHDRDNLMKLLPTDGSVTFDTVTTQYGVFVLAGPRARDLLAKLTETDLSNAAFPWLTGKMISVGAATALAMRVNYVGELGWELHHPIEMQNYLFDLLFDGGGARSSASGRSACKAPWTACGWRRAYKLVGTRTVDRILCRVRIGPRPLRLDGKKGGVPAAGRRCCDARRERGLAQCVR